jgi:GMP synthase (glutamine-hydrolysing)
LPPSSSAPTGPLIGILACDHVEGDELLGASGGADYDAMYARMLRLADPSITTRTYDAVGGELPEGPDECDGWIITGARHDSYSDEAWVVALRTFVADLYGAQARTVGVCFGHQLVAHALGGEAGPAGEWKAGPLPLEVDPTPWFAGGRVHLHAMHRDVARVLPPDAVTIGRGTTAEHPIYLVGDSILCIQDHPEFDTVYVSALIDVRRPRFGDDFADAALETVATTGTDGDVVGGWIVDFLLDRRA